MPHIIGRRSSGTHGIAGLLLLASAATWGARSRGWLSPPPSRAPFPQPCKAGTSPPGEQTRPGEAASAPRRAALAVALGLLAAAAPGARSAGARVDWLSGRKKDPRFKEWWGRGGSTMSEAAVQEAAASLTPLQRYVVLEGGVEDDTEGRRFANGYPWDNTESGVYVSVVSGVPLFASRDKLEDPRIGWPGFRGPIDAERLVIRPDPRTPDCIEVLDRASMTHLGHIVGSDAHYCINAASLRFIPAEASRAAAP
mmetsp:Transcript_105563/g.340441  ORF Transcript_105563/g.340441 Transcript_105563/m.340441 type:complete len:254 (-) Transcript_105563:89-850(-)